MRALQQLLHKCNALLVSSPVDDILLDIQVTLNQALQDLEVRSYQQFRVRDKKQEVYDHNSVSHKFFHGLHASHARMNVVRIEVDGTLSTNPQVIIDNCIQHFTKLLGHESILDNDMKEARAMFFQSIKGNVRQQVVMSIEEDIREEEVESVLSHLANDKSPGWDGITNEFFKSFVQDLKGPLTTIFQEVWSSGNMPNSWKIGLIKLIPKVASPTSFGQWRPISLMGGLYKIFTKVIANRL